MVGADTAKRIVDKKYYGDSQVIRYSNVFRDPLVGTAEGDLGLTK